MVKKINKFMHSKKFPGVGGRGGMINYFLYHHESRKISKSAVVITISAGLAKPSFLVFFQLLV